MYSFTDTWIEHLDTPVRKRARNGHDKLKILGDKGRSERPRSNKFLLERTNTKQVHLFVSTTFEHNSRVSTRTRVVSRDRAINEMTDIAQCGAFKEVNRADQGGRVFK